MESAKTLKICTKGTSTNLGGVERERFLDWGVGLFVNVFLQVGTDVQTST
jgi:hypothetical protein